MNGILEDVSKLERLQQCGQSYWLDNLTRDMIDSGELAERVDRQGLRGVTSNPQTFAKSVQSTEAYDADIARLARDGESVAEIYETLMVDDVRRGCDVLRPVYDDTGGSDGFVSIEVDPRLARQAEATLDAARRLWDRVDRPNAMIKIPGTSECLDAIEQCLLEGININITLLFSNRRYRQVVARYLRAMHRRLGNGDPCDRVASVASFFLSRIDILVDELLEQRVLPSCEEHIGSSLLGKAAIAQARLAYRSYQEAFSGCGWEKLGDRGVRTQRPLWASTSVKDPKYADTMYVENLVAADTVNTMPEKTIEAFADHGSARRNAIEHCDEDPQFIWDAIEDLGIDIDYVSRRLEDEGIQKFIDPFNEGMEAIERLANAS